MKLLLKNAALFLPSNSWQIVGLVLSCASPTSPNGKAFVLQPVNGLMLHVRVWGTKSLEKLRQSLYFENRQGFGLAVQIGQYHVSLVFLYYLSTLCFFRKVTRSLAHFTAMNHMYG